MQTDSQKDDLNRAIYDYLRMNSLEGSMESFRSECPTDQSAIENHKPVDLQEKKWVSIIRLQKKIIDLEGRIEELEAEINTLSKFKRRDLKPEETELLMPKPPSKSVLTGHKGVVNKVEFHPFYTTIGSAGEDGALKLWDFETGRLETTLKGHTKSINSLAFDTSGNLCATASSDLSIKIWDLNENCCIKTLNGHDHTVSSVQWNQAGTHLLTASRDSTIKIWEVSSGFCIRTMHGHKEWVRYAVYNSVDTLIASCSNDQTIILWQIGKEEPLLHMYGHEHVIERLIFANPIAKGCIHNAKWNKEASAAKKEEEKTGDKTMDDIIKESKEKLAKRSSLTGEDKVESDDKLAFIEYIISGGRDNSHVQ